MVQVSGHLTPSQASHEETEATAPQHPSLCWEGTISPNSAPYVSLQSTPLL